MPFCNKCGTEVPENINFCSKCEGNQQPVAPKAMSNARVKFNKIAGVAVTVLVILGAIAKIAAPGKTPGKKSVNSSSEKESVIVTDSRDGKTYKTVKIGSQIWMAENLNVDISGSKCYDDDSGNCAKYGRLYEWAAANKACPAGWHLPSDAEWTVLANFVGEATAGTELKVKSNNGTDKYGFSALPGGVSYNKTTSQWLDTNGYWWSGSENDDKSAYYRGMGSDFENISRNNNRKTFSMSVRCIKNDVSSSEAEKTVATSQDNQPKAQTGANTFTDSRDSKTYKTAKIGTQTWMAQNLDYHGTDGFLGLCYGDYPKQKIKKPENCKKYGRLYDWDEAMKACPKGWHLPSKEEWQTLVDFAGGDETAGKKLKAKSWWDEYDFSEKSPKAPKCKWAEEKMDNRGRTTVEKYDYCNTDEYGFAALPGGVSDGSFKYAGEFGIWWSSTDNIHVANCRFMTYDDERARWDVYNKPGMMSVRCLQD